MGSNDMNTFRCLRCCRALDQSHAFRSACSARRVEPMAASSVAAVKRAGFADACHGSAEKPSAFAAASERSPHIPWRVEPPQRQHPALACSEVQHESVSRSAPPASPARPVCRATLQPTKRAGHCRVKDAPRQRLPRWCHATNATFSRWCAARVLRARWRLCNARRQGAWAALQLLRSRRRRSVAKCRNILLLHVCAAALWRRLT